MRAVGKVYMMILRRWCSKPRDCEMRHAVPIRERKRRKGVNARGSAEIVWTAGPPNDRRGETESTLEEKRERGTLTGLYDSMVMPEGRLKYMYATYRLSTSCTRKGNLGGAGDRE